MTHTAGLCVAAVGYAQQYVSIGLDAEPNEALPPDLLNYITSSDEQEALRANDIAASLASRAVFSAKESVAKAIYPITGRLLDFSDIIIKLSSSGMFRATVDRSVADPARFAQTVHGGWTANMDHVVTWLALARPTTRTIHQRS